MRDCEVWPSFLTFIVMPEPNIVFHRELLVHVKVGNAKNRNVLALREVGGLTATAKLRNCKLCGKKEGGGWRGARVWVLVVATRMDLVDTAWTTQGRGTPP